jgi:hypothetical protein
MPSDFRGAAHKDREIWKIIEAIQCGAIADFASNTLGVLHHLSVSMAALAKALGRALQKQLASRATSITEITSGCAGWFHNSAPLQHKTINILPKSEVNRSFSICPRIIKYISGRPLDRQKFCGD